jgi:hypothetical protein
MILKVGIDSLLRYKTKSGWGIDKIVFEEAEDGVMELVYEPLNLRLTRVKGQRDAMLDSD